QFSQALVEDGIGQWLVLVSAPIGAQAPVVIGAFFLTPLIEKTIAIDTSSEGVFIWLVDDAGRVLFQQGTPPQEDLAHHPCVAEALSGQSGGIYRTVAGSEHVIAFSPVPSVGWALAMEEPWEEVDNPLLRQTLVAPLILVPVLIFALVALGFGIRQIIQPLRK